MASLAAKKHLKWFGGGAALLVLAGILLSIEAPALLGVGALIMGLVCILIAEIHLHLG
jgi:hypothetical protein